MAEFDSTEGGINQWSARMDFLYLLEKLASKAVNDLTEKPFEALSKIHCEPKQWQWLLSNKGNLEWLLTFPPEQLPNHRSHLPILLRASFPIFHKTLYDWANTYNLIDEWLIIHFFELLIHWIEYPKAKGKDLGSYFGHAFMAISDDSQFNDGTKMKFDFQFPAWRFNEQDKKDYRRAIQEAFNKSLNDYFKRIDNFALESGYKRNQLKKKLETHLRWFILYQVKRKTYKEIAEICQDNKGIDEPRIILAVHDIAKLLGITLREGSKRGRKPKT